VPSLVVLVRMLRPAMFVLLSTRPLRTFFSRGAVSFAAARMLEVATSATTGWGALESAAWHSSLSVVAVSGCLCDGAALAVGDSGVIRCPASSLWVLTVFFRGLWQWKGVSPLWQSEALGLSFTSQHSRPGVQ